MDEKQEWNPQAQSDEYHRMNERNSRILFAVIMIVNLLWLAWDIWNQ